jgi:diguanylate cyclase (GGDEF)-like protein
VAERRAALLGWAIEAVDIQDIVAGAIGSSALGATVTYRNPAGVSTTVARLASPFGATTFSSTIRGDIDGKWTITLTGSSPVGSLSPVVQGALAGAGVFLILGLLIVLVMVLSRSRANALDLVDRRTSQLAHQALHDALTGLPNRTLILDRATQMIARAERGGRQVGALFLDLDNFKAINDSLGHAAGDLLLQAMSARLGHVLRASDTVGRMGGDEFVVLVESDHDDVGPETLAERLLAQLRQPYVLEGVSTIPFTVTASIGIAHGRRESAEELLRDADIALYAAKAAGKNCYRTFRSEMQYAVTDRLELEMDLWTALEHGQLFVLYQPIVDLATEELRGVEALLRWHHPGRGLMSPDAFIPIAEDTGLILPIGRWVLGEACRHGAEWNRRHPGLEVSVNLSARQLESDELLGEVRAALADAELDPGLLTLEITESALMRDGPAARDRLAELKAIGIRVAVDDFGTGYSSFAYLQQFPVDALKIDRSFINDVARRSDATALVRTLIQLGKGLNLETLAEGIETRAQLTTLQLERCDKGQGFLFSRPVDAMAIDQMIGSLKR